MRDVIEVVGAREHNLKGVSLRIPKHTLAVFTGVSGSGKSSMAFDTLYAEGQRRYVESLSSYARQFLGQMEKPKYDSIRGLSPTIAIEQKSASNNPRSTVGTVTEIYDYLRVFFARLGVQHCHKCGRKASGQTPAQILTALMALGEGARIVLMAPIIENRKGDHVRVLEEAKERGFARVCIDGRIVSLDDEPPKLDKKSKHDIAYVVDRIALKMSEKARLTDSLEQALRWGEGRLQVLLASGETQVFSEKRACIPCGISFADLSPQSFSFNSPMGACAECNGLGTRPEMSPELLIPDPEKTINEGAVLPWAAAMTRAEGWKAETVLAVLTELRVPLDVPWKKLGRDAQQAVLTGMLRGKRVWEGLQPQLMRRFLGSASDEMKAYYMRFLSEKKCSRCEGSRLRDESRAVRIGDMTLEALCKVTVAEAHAFIAAAPVPEALRVVVSELFREISARLGFLLDVGLDYLTLARGASTLSGGESQRIRLASQIGSELTGVLYVLDEPSIGLHQRDNARLLTTLLRLRDLGNTVIVVEHDEDTIRAADFVADFGPLAGELGGHVVVSGLPSEVEAHPESLTGAYLSGRKRIAVPSVRRKGSGLSVSILGAREHNLKNLDVKFPLGTLTAVTGVSGAGKSTLVNRILLPALGKLLHDAREVPGAHRAIKGLKHLDKVIAINQQPIGRTPRSNPATYVKLFDHIRGVFAQTREARTYGYEAGRFSFNVKGGRCEGCGGDGLRTVEMHFLPDVYVTCEECKGLRFNEATLRVRFKEKTIADVLAMSIDEAFVHFSAHKEIVRPLGTLRDVGLGYMKLGQPSPTLSGGEAQRIKLARELSRVATSRTLYVLDEPTTGLHFADIERLIDVLNRLVDAGNTVVVIEHNLDVIKCADWVIDLGPVGGDQGGELVASGTPEAVAGNPESETGRWLAQVLGAKAPVGPQRARGPQTRAPSAAMLGETKSARTAKSVQAARRRAR
jgi:excinuclease ABC subunit A